MKRSQAASKEIPSTCKEEVLPGRAVQCWQRLRGNAEEFPCLVTVPQPGLAASPALWVRCHCELFCASSVATLTSEERKRFECVCSLSKSSTERKWHKAVALIGGELRFRGRDQNMPCFLIKTKIYCTMGFCHYSLPSLGSVVGLPSCAAEKEGFPCLQ